MIKLDELPTHLARVGSRLNTIGMESSGDTFLIISYLIESFVKTIAISLWAAVKKANPSIAYGLEYDFVRGDGLGIWDSAISTMTGNAFSGYVPRDIQALVEWITKKRNKPDDTWVKDSFESCEKIIELLGLSDHGLQKPNTIKHVLSQLVLIRNKTKAHGAAGPDFFKEANPLYENIICQLLEKCPINCWEWFFISWKSQSTIKAISLKGLNTTQTALREGTADLNNKSGIFFRSHQCGMLFNCDPIIYSTDECARFWIANGGFTQSGMSEYIDYTCHQLKQVDSSAYIRPPVPLPPSGTEGELYLDIYSNVFGNLPARPSDYIERKKLQEELYNKILDKNHPIITLHGRGGKGKTYLALYTAHKISSMNPPNYEYIVWLSARDLELRPEGPSEVRRGVANLEDTCKVIGNLFNIGKTKEAFSELLREPKCINSSGILFIFDNFETLDDPVGFHKFLDTYTHIPNKIVITSREKAFKGDYPIEVEGMEYEEARQLIINQGRNLGIEGFLPEDRIEQIIEYTDGHAYVIRVLLGEIAKEQKWIPIKSLVTRRTDLLNAVFERSFNRLSESGKYAFLTIGNWRSIVSELAILAVLGLRDIEIESGIEECLRLALINKHEYADGSYGYSTPELAHIFAKKKIEGDPDKYSILEDLTLLEKFGPLKVKDINGTTIDIVMNEFYMSASDLAESSLKREKIEQIMKRVAEAWPKGWLLLASYYEEVDSQKREEIRYCLRRAVEEMPFDKEAWIARAEFANKEGDWDSYVFSLISAADADHKDLPLIINAAYQVNLYIKEKKIEIPLKRRGLYLANIRSIMVENVGRLDANGLSKLAWLYLHENNEEEARRYAQKGLEIDPRNKYCLKIIDNLN